MAEIINGTTPTITYKFTHVDVSEITKAILTIKKGKNIAIEKTLTEATVGENTISWRMTQAQTLSVLGSAEVMINWVTSGGVRGASNKTLIIFTGNHIMEVV